MPVSPKIYLQHESLPKFLTHISKYLLITCAQISRKHLTLNTSQTQLLILTPNSSPIAFSLLLASQSSWEFFSLLFLFHAPHPIHQQILLI